MQIGKTELFSYNLREKKLSIFQGLYYTIAIIFLQSCWNLFRGKQKEIIYSYCINWKTINGVSGMWILLTNFLNSNFYHFRIILGWTYQWYGPRCPTIFMELRFRNGPRWPKRCFDFTFNGRVRGFMYQISDYG